MCRSPVEPRVCVSGDHHGNSGWGVSAAAMVPEMTRTSGLGPEGRVCYQNSPEMVDQSPNRAAGNRGWGAAAYHDPSKSCFGNMYQSSAEATRVSWDKSITWNSEQVSEYWQLWAVCAEALWQPGFGEQGPALTRPLAGRSHHSNTLSLL